MVTNYNSLDHLPFDNASWERLTKNGVGGGGYSGSVPDYTWCCVKDYTDNIAADSIFKDIKWAEHTGKLNVGKR